MAVRTSKGLLALLGLMTAGTGGLLGSAVVAQGVHQCFGVAATIVGTPGPDTIVGTTGADVIAAGDGNDTINGRGGDDRISGGRGRDEIHGGRGNDPTTTDPDRRHRTR